MNIIEVELELDDDRFCGGCKLAKCDDYFGDPDWCILDMDWSTVIVYQDYKGNIKAKDILSRDEYNKRRKSEGLILAKYHTGFDGWYEKLLRPQECIDRTKKE